MSSIKINLHQLHFLLQEDISVPEDDTTLISMATLLDNLNATRQYLIGFLNPTFLAV